MSEPRYKPGVFEPVLYLFFWFFQTWGWIILFLFLGWKLMGCWLPDSPEMGEDSTIVMVENIYVEQHIKMG